MDFKPCPETVKWLAELLERAAYEHERNATDYALGNQPDGSHDEAVRAHELDNMRNAILEDLYEFSAAEAA